jgi:hypothetical protein
VEEPKVTVPTVVPPAPPVEQPKGEGQPQVPTVVPPVAPPTSPNDDAVTPDDGGN